MTIWLRALHAVLLRLQTHTRNMQYVMLLHCNNSCTNAHQYYLYVHGLSCNIDAPAIAKGTLRYAKIKKIKYPIFRLHKQGIS